MACENVNIFEPRLIAFGRICSPDVSLETFNGADQATGRRLQSARRWGSRRASGLR